MEIDRISKIAAIRVDLRLTTREKSSSPSHSKFLAALMAKASQNVRLWRRNDAATSSLILVRFRLDSASI
jgi:hypothetical protein